MMQVRRARRGDLQTEHMPSECKGVGLTHSGLAFPSGNVGPVMSGCLIL